MNNTYPKWAVGLLALALAGPAQAQYSSDSRYDPNQAHSTEVIQNLKMMSPEQRVDTAMALLKGTWDSGPKIATQILLQERPEFVVPKLVDAIAYDMHLQDQDRRRHAFIVLAAKQEWPNPMTYDLLADGLLDFRVEDVCRLALENAPKAQRNQAAQSLAGRLDQWYQQHGPATGVALEVLGAYGSDAMPAAPMVEKIFLAPLDRWPENRTKAAKSLAQIGGLPMAVEKYKHMDTLQYIGAMDGLAWLGEQSPSPYASDSSRTRLARIVTLEALAVPSVGVVRGALAALPWVYGDALYLPSDTTRAVNPEVKTGLITGAEKQTDPMLRSVLVTALRQYEASTEN